MTNNNTIQDESTIPHMEVVPETIPNGPIELTQQEKDAKFIEVQKALSYLQQLKKKKHRGQNPGAFGGKNFGIKKKKKLARWVEKNTVI